MIALILGAGWKPFNQWKLSPRLKKIIPPRTPELFWPLGSGTVLSRYMKQLEIIGVTDVFVCIGKPGSRTKPIEDSHGGKYKFKLKGYGEPVWSMDHVRAVLDLDASPIMIPDPMARGKNCWTTLLYALTWMEKSHVKWDRVISLAGDYALDTGWLYRLAKTVEYPTQCWMLPKHSIEFLNRKGMRTFAKWLEGLSPLSQKATWLRRGELESLGVAMKYIWTQPLKSLPTAVYRRMVDERREGFCEVGPGEYPFAVQLVEKDKMI